MSFHFCFGPSGSGKSHYLIHEVSRLAEESTRRLALDNTFLYIVPEQFTMQTQKDLVMASPSHGIMNVDVLSFGRLGHRIFEEMGTDTRTSLDDVGKSLILQKTASSLSKSLKVIGAQMNRPGMIAEVKSMISEFMQYGLDPEAVGRLSAYAAGHGQNSLALKLSDLQALYQAFLDNKDRKYVTSEETMELLSKTIPDSGLIRRSVIVFDGFTGFTPVQYEVLRALMQTAKEVVFAITIAQDGGPDPAACEILPTKENIRQGLVPVLEEQDLFYLSRKTIRNICIHAADAGVEHTQDVYLSMPREGVAADNVSQRFGGKASLAFLEQQLFRYPLKTYQSAVSDLAGSDIRSAAEPEEGLSIELSASSTMMEEVRQIAIRIQELVRRQGYAYRDIALICGSLEDYAPLIQQMAALYRIPVYIDQTRAVLQNPLTEAMQSALEIAGNDYSYATVFRYLRSGLSSVSREEVDRLENYCLAHGVNSRRKWSKAFDEEVEGARQAFLKEMAPLETGKRLTAAQRTVALYFFLEGLGAEGRMLALADAFRTQGILDKQQEYEQCYGKVMHLLDQIYALLGDEKISSRDYADLIHAGLSEIRLGTLPQQVDRVLVGDMERTRLGQVKVLFFCGVNDGNIPKNASRGGLISDLDREFLDQAGVELAPTPRSQMYIQRLYLYLNLTKETDRLILTYAHIGQDGRSLRPSYLVSLLQNMYPDLKVAVPEEKPLIQQLVAPADTKSFVARGLRLFADGTDNGDNEVLPVYAWCMDPVRPPSYRQDILRLKDAAFARYTPRRISRQTANRLYGNRLYGSVSRLETAVQCYLKQFLRHGLCLRQRDEYQLEAADAGTILHDGIARFCGKLGKRGLRWRDMDEKTMQELVHEAVSEEAADYRNHLLLSSARSQAGTEFAERILMRTVRTLQFQLQQGSFEPAAYEQPFGEHGELCYALPGGGEMILEGRIDRVDTAIETKDGRSRCWIKIIDYKSGSLDLDEEEIRKGLRLQLMLYMDATISMIRGLNPETEVLPAALLYYRFQDPLLDAQQLPADVDEIIHQLYEQSRLQHENRQLMQIHGDFREETKEALLSQLRPRGMVSDEEDAITLLDQHLNGKSLVIPVSRTRSGALSRTSRTFSCQEYEELSEVVRQIIIVVAGNILSGNIAADPAQLAAGRTACSYCEFSNVCGFDPKIPGCHYQNPDPLGSQDNTEL